MSAPTIQTSNPQLEDAVGKLAQSPDGIDSAKSVTTPQNFHGDNNNKNNNDAPSDEKERRLLDYVSKMDELRKTTGPEGFRIQQGLKVKGIIKNLLVDSDKIEEHINLGENELFFKGDEAFFTSQNETEVNQLLARQAEELRALKNLQEQLIKDRCERKEAKRFQRELQRESKLKDSIIHDQDAAHKTAKEVKTILSEHLQRIEQLVSHTEEKHKKQLAQLSDSQDRKISDQRILMELQCRNLAEDEKNDQMKEFHFKINHQKSIDKKVTDQLRERQAMELRHLKDRMDMETMMKEELSTIKANLLVVQQQTARSQRLEYVTEKDRIDASCEAQKVIKLQVEDNIQVNKLLSHQRQQVRLLKRDQKSRKQKRLRTWALVTGRNMEVSASGLHSKGSESRDSDSAELTRSSSGNSINVGGGRLDIMAAPKEGVDSFETDTDAQNNFLDNQQKLMTDKVKRMRDQLQGLALRHKLILEQLVEKQKIELKEKENTFTKDRMELEWNQDVEIKDMNQSHEHELQEANAIYAHELEMEAQVRSVETKALQERKVLNSLLDTVVDGVISIDPLGIIKRFNSAAEKMFKLSASEAIGQNIKKLMPKEHSVNHDEYLYNYLSTGIRKVIGIGRQLNGVKSDGTLFPINLAVSEVVEEGLHLFTAIVRDLTEQNAHEARIKAEEERQQAEMKILLDNLAVAKQKSTNLLGSMLPNDIADRIMQGEIIKPEQFTGCTIFFSNIVGFSEIAAECKSHDIVNLLNDLYTYFDSVVDHHDVYKVETVGSAYLVVSGIPNRNGDRHACEIADMSLSLLSGIHSSFKVRHLPGLKLQLRIGMHSGPCVSGVVGTKMPRYCLFGDTVNTASRMESAGSPMRIQVSEPAFKILKNAGGYHIEKRGEVSVKGKGNMVTYWLLGKDGFDKPLPKPEDWPVIAQ